MDTRQAKFACEQVGLQIREREQVRNVGRGMDICAGQQVV